jgi:hypothetical protein
LSYPSEQPLIFRDFENLHLAEIASDGLI